MRRLAITGPTWLRWLLLAAALATGGLLAHGCHAPGEDHELLLKARRR